jgi:hypothetical protein
MKPIIYNASYLLNENLMDFNIPVEIHVTRFLKNTFPQYIIKHQLPSDYNSILLNDVNYKFDSSTFRIFIDSNEPKVCYMKEKEKDILQFANFYNLILTTNPKILNTISHSRLFPYGTTWLNKLNKDETYLGEIDPTFNGFDLNKENTISFLKTNKSKDKIKIVPGYNLREKVWSIKNKIKLPVKFYYSNVGPFNSDIKYDGPLPEDNKLNLFKSKFSIIIENSQEISYFSEKLIDCLLTKTIPIYWGCPNICDYFDCNGFILFSNENELIDKINNIDIDLLYNNLSKFIDINFEKSKYYALNYSSRVEKTIKEYINGRNFN